jgi:hypothetical protein
MFDGALPVRRSEHPGLQSAFPAKFTVFERHGMLDLIVKLLGRRAAQDLVASSRMARVAWIALQQGRPRSALES